MITFVNVRNNSGVTPLHYSAMFGRSSFLGISAEFQLDLNAPDEFGKTALHLAVDGGFSDFAKQMLAMGADATIQDCNGSTPFDVAEERNDSNMARMLRQLARQSNQQT